MSGEDFYIGQPVQLSKRGHVHFAATRNSRLLTGGVIVHVQKNGFVKVRLNGNKTPGLFHPSFWEPADAGGTGDE